MKNARAYLLSGLLVAGATVLSLSFSQRAEAQSPNTSPNISPTVRISPRDPALTQLNSLNSKLNKLLQSQGGRYLFLVSDGELMRLDTQEGKIAMFNIVSGASWDTLDIPEKTIGPGNAFFEKYVQFLDKTEFNNN